MDIVEKFKTEFDYKGNDLFYDINKNRKYRNKLVHQRYVNIKLYDIMRSRKSHLQTQIDLKFFSSEIKTKVKKDIEEIDNILGNLKKEQILISDILKYHPDRETYRIFQ